MPLSRRLLLALPLPLLLEGIVSAAAQSGTAPAVIQHLYDDLLAVMKEAKRLSFDERYNRLAPAILRTFDLGLMTRIALGAGWTQLTPEQQQRLAAAFSRYTISIYANRFDGYGGERFEVLSNAAANPNGLLVNTRLIKSNGETENFNYLLREETGGSWKVIDVYLNGTISELAARRSEFSAVLQRSGAQGLVELIEKRTAALRTG